MLRAEVDRALITELRKKNAKDPYATFDVSDLTIYQNGHVFVGDAGGTHVDVTQLPSMTDTPNPITLDGQTYADVHTFRDAIDQARVLLPRKRAAVSSDITEVTATTETEPNATLRHRPNRPPPTR